MGRAAAECFAADGARVAVLARGQEALDATVGRLRELGSPDALGISTDITEASAIEAAFAQIGERWGELNTLVNAAGPQVSQQRWEDVSDQEWYDAFTIGTLAAVRCARVAVPLMRAGGWGRIINLSAMSSKSNGFGLAEYTAAKAALNSVTKNMSLELGPEGILANVVSPGTYVSDQLRDFVEKLPAEEEVNADDLESVMRYISRKFAVRADLGRAGDPAEIGPVIAFLGSPRNTYITGANLNVDGGSAFN